MILITTATVNSSLTPEYGNGHHQTQPSDYLAQLLCRDSELDLIRSVEEISTEIATVSWISKYAPRRPELEATQK